MAASRAEKILQTLRETFALPKWAVPRRNPFETLIVTIISQNTAGRNTAKAFENLSKKFRITPEALANAEISQIEKCLNVAGLYRNKSKIIKQISKIIHEKFHDDLKPILSLSFEEARRTLLELPGIGPKTADVVLLFCAEKPTVPVDTHVNRVAKRLGLAPANGNYEMVRESLQSLYDAKDYLVLHVLLIQLGRSYCKSRNPLCKQCAVNMLCPSKQLWDNND
ncbi:MAG: endonuclease III [Candidatus Bathyarchaeota archaeon]|nr:endonuclease III [Candidatus Bathyarchaeota archaeon]MDH5787294.1 endonuclease III [Candidatus Bathyarchaeota archaeon]